MSQTRRRLQAAEREAHELYLGAIAAGTDRGLPMIRQLGDGKYDPSAMKTAKAELIFNLGNALLTQFLIWHGEVISDYCDDKTSDPIPVCVSFVRIKVAINEQRKHIEAGADLLEAWHAANLGEPESFFVEQHKEWTTLAETTDVIFSEFRERLAWFETESRCRGQRTFLDAQD